MEKEHVGHPIIYDLISSGINEIFLQSIQEDLESCYPKYFDEKYKEKKLKKITTLLLIENIDNWLSKIDRNKYNVPKNPAISIETSLPILKIQPDNLKTKVQTFDFKNSIDNDEIEFMSPTDIAINTTGWFPDPVFHFSLVNALELKVLKEKDNNFYKKNLNMFENDIIKIILFLRYCLIRWDYLKKIQLKSETYQHITNGLDELFTKSFLIYVCFSDNELKDAECILNNYKKYICVEKHCNKLNVDNGSICLLKINLKA